MATLFRLPKVVPIDSGGVPYAGATLEFFLTGTDTNTDTYTDSALTTPHANPVVADAAGVFAPIYLDPEITYKATLSQSDATLIYTVDPVSEHLTQASIGALLYPQTSSEQSAGATPENYEFMPPAADRYETNATPGTTDMVLAVQSAIDSADAKTPSVMIAQQNGISSTLLIKSGTVQGISIIGGSKHSAIIEPLAADIKNATQNVNCCIFNQHNNAHLRLENMRFQAAAAFTGVAVYCLEGGGDDASGQALFSTVIRNIFCDLPSTNTGFLHGALQNSVIDTATFENAKGVLNIEGVGHSDNHYTNISLYNCFDQFINQTADTNGSFLISVRGLHAYTHNRGRLFDMQNVNGMVIEDVILEPASGNLGSVGIAKFTDSTNIVISDVVAVARSGVPQADIAFEVSGSGATSIKISNAKIDAAIGLLISATGAMDIELDNCEFVNSVTAAIQVTGACSGVLKTRNCKFNDCDGRAILHSTANSMDWISENDELINAGLDSDAGNRNITLDTSGDVILRNPRIGQDDAGAAAAYYVDASGSGTVRLIHPEFIGTPPTGLKTGAQTVSIDYRPGYGGSLASAAALGLPSYGTFFVVTGTTAITSIPVDTFAGARHITLKFSGALTFTHGSNLVLAGGANFSTAANDVIELVGDGTNYYEVSRSDNSP